LSIALRRLSFSTLLCGELLGYLALALSPEVDRIALAAVPLAVALLFLLGLRIGDRLLLLLVGGVVVAGLAGGYFSGLPMAIILSRGLLAVHGLLWLPRDRSAYRYWRLGIAFLEIILASILSPETHMFLIIFFFAMIASLALSFGFLERKFGSDPRLPLQFLASIFLLTFVIFLSSLVIFPLLPRSSGTGLGQQWSEPGYTETVDLRSSISWAAGSSRPMLWMFRPEGVAWPKILPYGLLRGAVLDRFTGEEWRPGAKQYGPLEPALDAIKVEIFREPVNANILPAPYGTSRLALGGRERGRYRSGEWPALSQRNKRVRYEAWVGGGNLNDEPKAIHREIPAPEKFPTITRLAAGWNRRGVSESEKIARVREYFRDFKWSLAPMQGAEGAGPHPVENFLQRTKEGHCELFATSAALLFRAMGMPSRLVAGFRAFPEGDLLTARNTDAHAWVEVWVKGRGWVPVDPSPVVAAEASWAVFDLYDQLNAYWYRYIVGYEFDGRALLSSLWGPGLGLAALLILLAAISRLRSLRLTWRRREPREAVTRAWEKIERKLGDSLGSSAAREVRGLYLELRFGPSDPAVADIARLKRSAAALARSIAAK
jgi:hypothetical protein